MKAKREYTKEEKVEYFKNLLKQEEYKNAILSAKTILSDDRISKLKKIIDDLMK